MGKKTKFHTLVPHLPDGIIINILSRLPAKNAARCRLVCKLWKDLTFSRCFLELHLRNTIPTILVTTSFTVRDWRSRGCIAISTNFTDSGIESFAIDNWWESDESRLFIHDFPFGDFPNACRVLFSHAGFIVLLENKFYLTKIPELLGLPWQVLDQVCFVIVNPVTREYTRIILPKELFHCLTICGVYFHPVLKEYHSLWKLEESEDSKRFQYKILTLGSQPSVKTIANPFINKPKMGRVNPISIDNHLYWMLDSRHGRYGGWNDVMKFDIRNEEFGVIPCPVPLNTKCFYDQTQLLDIHGILSYVLILPGKITIWGLQDRVSNSWVAAEYTFSIENWYNPDEIVDVIAVRDGKLAILSQEVLYVCNLTEGTVNSLQDRKYENNVSFLPHQMSLALLNNCKSTIFMDKNCEVVQDTRELEISGSRDNEEGCSVVRDKQEPDTFGSRDSMEGSSSSNGLAN